MGSDHLGQPSASNKSEGRGNTAPRDDEENQKVTDQYVQKEDEVADNVRQPHPNRNTTKQDATNAVGYKQ